jgi:hypothetical protein
MVSPFGEKVNASQDCSCDLAASFEQSLGAGLLGMARANMGTEDCQIKRKKDGHTNAEHSPLQINKRVEAKCCRIHTNQEQERANNQTCYAFNTDIFIWSMEGENLRKENTPKYICYGKRQVGDPQAGKGIPGLV